MIELRPWTDCEPPSQDAHVAGAWLMARAASQQHPQAVRMLYSGGELVALGGVCALTPADGLAFIWRRDGLSPFIWRHVLPALRAGLWSAHERGVRRISAIVAAMHAAAIRLIKALGFAFAGLETGFAGTTEPMLRYVRAWPAFPQSPLVAHQLRETELAAFVAWCPEML
jgi:RimJ/RimL family protein N-acetyltransferase